MYGAMTLFLYIITILSNYVLQLFLVGFLVVVCTTWYHMFLFVEVLLVSLNGD